MLFDCASLKQDLDIEKNLIEISKEFQIFQAKWVLSTTIHKIFGTNASFHVK